MTVLLSIVCAVLLVALIATATVALWSFRIATALYRTIERDLEVAEIE